MKEDDHKYGGYTKQVVLRFRPIGVSDNAWLKYLRHWLPSQQIIHPILAPKASHKATQKTGPTVVLPPRCVFLVSIYTHTENSEPQPNRILTF